MINDFNCIRTLINLTILIALELKLTLIDLTILIALINFNNLMIGMMI